MKVKIREIRVGQISLLSFSALFTLLRILQASDWELNIGLGLFGIWVVAPYIVFLLIVLRKKHSQLEEELGIFIASLLMLALTIFFYSDISSTSTASLIFVWGPLYLLIGAPILIAIGPLLAKKIISKN